MDKLSEKISEGNWDNLIVLDSCRYDFFKQFYKHYPNTCKGEVEKIESDGSVTPETLPKIFPHFYKAQVFSAHPWISSEEREIESVLDKTDYRAWNHFEEIIDVWKNASYYTGVTHPEKVVSAVEKNYDKERKTIAWFMQPHHPHIGKISICPDGGIPEIFKNEDDKVDETIVKLLRVSYKYNLLRVLYNVSLLVGQLEGKTVVTSDHGELLYDHGRGDNNVLHMPGRKDEELIHVPWLEIPEETTENLKELSDKEFVEKAYKSVFGREVKEEGIENYVPKLGKTINRSSLIQTLIHSKEFKEDIDNPNRLCLTEKTFGTGNVKNRMEKLGYF